jgi:hypothetical protein
MTTIRITPDLKAPAGATCYQCGATAIVQCSVCDHCMCFRHAQFFNNIPARVNPLHDYVECHDCDDGDDSGENEAEAATDV